MVWALSQNDPDHWLTEDIHTVLALIDENDFEFKSWLDKYKYADRFPENTEEFYRQQCEDFLVKLEQRLKQHTYLFSNSLSLADMAIFPFIRQFSGVNKNWFEQAPYPHLQDWLKNLVNSQLFISIMQKYPTWLSTQQSHIFPE
ncbi:glutathione S-transferase C-terminal domain-containing protein [Psychromonas sp. KJ10-10]|uniref:glutathione S-transferase C-terminal domain-containing protein n=1 Tax=Psychromonas sp. KJ10-10 TaxID=3391823 RepID=UPI0039B44B4F